MNNKFKLKKGDEVIILAGKDRGKKGKITKMHTNISKATAIMAKSAIVIGIARIIEYPNVNGPIPIWSNPNRGNNPVNEKSLA